MNIYPATFHGRVADQRKSPLSQKTARVTRCHKQFLTTTFLLSSKITQLDRRPAGTLCRPFARLLPHARKTFQQSVWFEDCNVSNYSGAKLLVVRTMPSEVVSQKTSQGVSHVSVRRGFRRRLSAKQKTKRSHVVAWLLTDKEHQSSRFRQNHIDQQLPRAPQINFVCERSALTSDALR